MLNLIMLYSAVAVVVAYGLCLLNRRFFFELFAADAIMGFTGAWLAGCLLGEGTPSIGGVSVLACLGGAALVASAFNGLISPLLAEERRLAAEVALLAVEETQETAKPLVPFTRPHANDLADVA